MPDRPNSPPKITPFAQQLAAAIVAQVGPARFNLWFQGHSRFTSTAEGVIVAVRNDACRDWLEQTFGEAVRTAATQVLGTPTPVRWVVEASYFAEPIEPAPAQPTKTRTPTKTTARANTPPPPAPSQLDLFGNPVPRLARKARRPDPEAEAFAASPSAHRSGRRWKLLSEFVIGPANRVAHAAAMSAVEDPGQGANPLVIHGPVGTGKTHLIEGIYAGLRRRWPELRPCFVTAEEFTTRFVQASRLGKMASFRRQFRDCPALLIDDLHFLATKRATQEEFLHTFDALLAEGRQVVVTTDCHPRLADELMPELTDRLLGGAVWGLLPPDAETRLELLRHKSALNPPPIADPVLQSLAAGLRGNVRELEGAVNSVRHFARVTGRPIDQSVVREALGDLLRHAVRVVTVREVDAAVCGVLRLAAGTLQSKARAWAVTHSRMVAIFLCRKHTAATYGEISKHFGAKTHSTAVAAEKKVRIWLDQDVTVAIGDRNWRVKELIDRVERDLQR